MTYTYDNTSVLIHKHREEFKNMQDRNLGVIQNQHLDMKELLVINEETNNKLSRDFTLFWEFHIKT